MNGTTQSGEGANPALSQALDRLWVRFLPEIRERVAVLEAAAAAVNQKKLTPSRREAAEAAAHKLAGVLGTFSLSRGTDLARELELTFSSKDAPTPSSGKHLSAITAELRALIEGRSSGH